MLFVRLFVAVVVGYMLGSIAMALIAPRAFHRAVPFRDRRAAVAAAGFFDVAKGVVAIPLLSLILGSGAGTLLLVPVFAVVAGHRLSLFFRFKGQTAGAPAAGVVLFALGYGAWISLFSAGLIAMILSAGIVLFVAVRRIEIPALLTVLSLWLSLVPTSPWVVETVAIGMGGILIIGFCIDEIRNRRLLQFPATPNTRPWRVVLRPFALLFIVIDQLANRRIVLFVMGGVAAVVIIIDAIRLISHSVGDQRIFTMKESGRISSITMFSTAGFLSFLLFPGEIPYVALVCMTMGDLLAKLVGSQYGRRGLGRGRSSNMLREKSLEGSFAFFAGSIAIGSVVASATELSLLYVLVGGAVGTLTELFVRRVDDNFAVSLLTGGALTLFEMLGSRV